MPALAWLDRLKAFRFVGQSLPCSLCGGLDREVVGRRDRYLAPLRNVLCSQCGLVFLDPMPTADEIERYYREEYREHYHGDSKPRAKSLLRDQRGALERVAILEPYLQAGDRVLDIGAGTGAFLAAATAAGWQAEGIEPHQGFAEYARTSLGANVHATTLEAAPVVRGSFALVTSSHVFEHLRDPLSAFRRVHALLREEGIFHVGVPNIANPKRTPIARFHFGHTHGFTRQTLTMMAFKAGFEPISDSFGDEPILLLRRLALPHDDWLRFPEHAQKMREFFRERTLWRHLTSGVPYQRFVKRMRRFRREQRELDG